MKKILKFAVFLAISSAVLYSFRQPIQEEFNPVVDQIVSQFSPVAPCSEPITYYLGSFDDNFGISKKYFLDAVSEAESIWEKPFGKNLFSYVPGNGALKINLVYDYRQQATEKLSSLGIEVKETRSSYDALKNKYISLKAQYDSASAEYNSKASDFEQNNKAYEERVNYWNTQGGVPKKEYSKLENEKALLQSEADELNKMRDAINEMVSEINSLAVALNRLADTLNISVEKYNAIGGARGESFQEGVYVIEGMNKEIDIYEFSSREKLVRVLAHELGHALGLEHLEDPKAIMYKLNQGSNSFITESDLNALKVKCGVK